MRDTLSLLSLSLLALQDYRKGEVDLWLLAGLLDVRYPCAYLLTALVYLTRRYWQKYIGGADTLTLCALLSRYPLLFVHEALLYACLLALLIMALKKERKVRFLPYLLFGFVLALLRRRKIL